MKRHLIISSTLAAALAATTFAQSVTVAPGGKRPSASVNASPDLTLSATGQDPALLARYGIRPQSLVARATPSPCVILHSGRPVKEMDELNEDLKILSVVFSRGLERVFGDAKETEYRMGVPMLLTGGMRLVDVSYIESYGILVKVSVPFPVVDDVGIEKKAESKGDSTEWEKARRTIYGDAEPANSTDAPQFDEKLVDSLKNQMLQAMVFAAKVRHVGRTESVTVAVVGANGVAQRPSVLTLAVRKSDADEASKESAKTPPLAAMGTYFDSPKQPGSSSGFGPAMGR